MTRRYREDSGRIIRLQSGIFVRRPQAVPQERVDWREVIGLTAFVAFMGFAIAWALPVLLTAVAS
jgi:hypothetical protein